DSANFLANAINSWVSPINHFEENTKQVNQIYLATWAEDISEFDSLQYETLYTIATESAATGGNATYAARVMLGLDINDDATQNNRLVSQTASIENNNGVTIYPNPVTNVATIAIDGIENEALAVELKDVLGKVVLPFKKLSATGTIDFGKIPNGIYFIAVYLNGNYLSSKKLIVSH
ncbi:MAG: T9SS type A sorting domain-containing protein, partial [Bacteroidia bacterium]|nr:T9SS type A sorting domain-containing protein [Bacteroidia bacterium]